MVTHYTVNACKLRPGDLLGSRTQLVPANEQSGSLLELDRGGKEPVTLNNGEKRTFIEDGDTLVVRGGCRRHGAAYRIWQGM